MDRILPNSNQIKVQTNLNEYTCDKLVIATGFVNKPLNVINEDKFVGRGISFCALCDAALTKDKNVLMYASNLKALEEFENEVKKAPRR